MRLPLILAFLIVLAAPALAQTAPTSISVATSVPSGDARWCSDVWSPTLGELGPNCAVLPESVTVNGVTIDTTIGFFLAYGNANAYGSVLGPVGSGFQPDGTVTIVGNPNASPATSTVNRAATSADYSAIIKAFSAGIQAGVKAQILSYAAGQAAAAATSAVNTAGASITITQQ